MHADTYIHAYAHAHMPTLTTMTADVYSFTQTYVNEHRYEEEDDSKDDVDNLCVDKDGKTPSRERMAVGCMLSGITYWRYRRTMLVCGLSSV